MHIATLDLRDPAPAFFQIDGLPALPLVIDTAEGAIAYSITEENEIALHGGRESTAEPLITGSFPSEPMSIVPFTYEQYRATALASSVFDESYLNSSDKIALASLGKDNSQVGGTHRFDNGTPPCCANPACLGTQTTTCGVSIHFKNNSRRACRLTTVQTILHSSSLSVVSASQLRG